MWKKLALTLLLGFIFLLGACKVEVPRQYMPYYNERGQLLVSPVKRVKVLRLPHNIGREILPDYLHNNLNYFSEWDTLGVDETFGIFEFEISADGRVEQVKMIQGDIPLKAQNKLLSQFRKMRFEPYKRSTKWYLPFYIEVPRGREIHPNGLVFEGKEAYLVWNSYNPRDLGQKRGFKGE